MIRVEPVGEEGYAEPGRCPDVGLMGLRDLFRRDARYLMTIHEEWHSDPRALDVIVTTRLALWVAVVANELGEERCLRAGSAAEALAGLPAVVKPQLIRQRHILTTRLRPGSRDPASAASPTRPTGVSAVALRKAP